jgi:uncharacterized lipoprotein YddW (UPF0748 family)
VQARAELVRLFDALQIAGINTVIFQVRSECDALYDSPHEPWSYWLTGVQGVPPAPLYDPLAFAVGEAHARGMELHAWFNPYRARRFNSTYPVAPSHVTARFPSWVITCPTGYKFLDPGLPEVRSFVAGVVSDVIRRYDIDGIHCDDYFYPYPGDNFTNQDASTFAAYPRGYTSVGDWRRDNVNLLLRMIRDSIEATKPHVKFGMSPFGIWRNNVPPGITGLDAYSSIYCDAMAWLRDGSIDYLTPQIYWRIGGPQDFAALVRWWGDSTSARGRHLYPGMAPYRINDPNQNWASTELPDQIRLTRTAPAGAGQVYFRANNGLLDNPKGLLDSLKSDLYSDLSLLPVMAWKDTVAPYPPRGIRYARAESGGQMLLRWELPLQGPDGDSASRYAVYRLDHYPGAGELDNPSNLLSIRGGREYEPPVVQGTAGPTYYVVTALDRNWNESDTSNVVRVAAPDPPELAAPTDGATGLPNNVTVMWRSTPLAASYRLQVSTDPTFASGLLVDQASIADTFRTLSNVLGDTIHFWRVGGSNAGGAGSFSPSFRFSTGFPASVTLLSPPDMSDSIPVPVTLHWGGSRQATTYHLQLSTVLNFVSTVVDSAGLPDTSLEVGELQSLRYYFWRVRAENPIGTSPWSPPFRFRTTQLPVAVAVEEGMPAEFRLDQNFPNPFNPVTTIRFALPKASHVSLKVYDLLGREEATLVDVQMDAGAYSVQWDASQSATGAYFLRLMADSFTATRRMVLVR